MLDSRSVISVWPCGGRGGSADRGRRLVESLLSSQTFSDIVGGALMFSHRVIIPLWALRHDAGKRAI